MRILVAFLVLATGAFGAAQSNDATSEPTSTSRSARASSAKRQTPKTKTAPVRSGAAKQAPKPAEDLLGRALTWVRKSTYAVTKGGKAYAEGLIRRTPKTFANVREEVAGLTRRVAKSESLRDLDEKRRYVAELWRLRASLDLMALLDARTLQMLTGIDAKTLETLGRSLADVAKTLGLSPAGTRPATKAAPKG